MRRRGGRQPPAPACIFCGGRPITSEHIWPRGLAPILALFAGELGTAKRTRTSPASMALQAPRKVEIQRMQGHHYNRRLRCVCANCNNGWMAKIEEEAHPILGRLILGMPCEMDDVSQIRLVRWAALRTAIWERDHPASAALTKAELEALYLEQKPPSGFRIWMSAYFGGEWQIRMHHAAHWLGYVALAGRPQPNTQTTSIGAGALFIHVASTTSSPGVEFIELNPLFGMERIWPVRDAFLFPTRIVLDDAAATGIAMRMEFRSNAQVWP